MPVAEHYQTHATVPVQGFADHPFVTSLGNHHRREDARKHRAVREWQQDQLRGENRIGGDYLPVLHHIKLSCARRGESSWRVGRRGLMRRRDSGKLPCMPSDRRRNSIESAIVLQAARMGEIHRRVTLFTGERGVVYATAHGAGKAVSKLKPATIVFALITAYLYHDPVRNSFKITDVEARNLHPSFRADLRKFFTASLWVEIVLRSHGGGTDAGDLYALLVDALQRLDGAAERDIGLLSAQVLWRALQQLGISPDLECCDTCGRALGQQEDVRLAPHGGSWCQRCTGVRSVRDVPAAALHIDAPARRFLLATGGLPLAEAGAYSFAGAEKLRRSLQQLVQHGLERPLNSLRCAAGIL